MPETPEHQICRIIIGKEFNKRKEFNEYIKKYYPDLWPFVKNGWKQGYFSARPYCYVSLTRKFDKILCSQAYNQTLSVGGKGT